MEFRDLQYLVVSVDAGNFTRAAKALNLNPSTVSSKVARLENELGLPLFERRQSGVHLTAGEVCHRPCETRSGRI
jgi:DNA-binding transcriptional LysR family regulator